MTGKDRAMGERLHAIIKANAPILVPKLWYGMPAYADKDGKVICFFQAASKFKVRYATFGFQPDAELDRIFLTSAVFSLNLESGYNTIVRTSYFTKYRL